MDWRNNQWVGLGAAGLLLIFIVIIVMYVSQSSQSRLAAMEGGMQFKCDACGETFIVGWGELDDYDTYKTYKDKYGQAVPCRECGEVAAYQSYYCPQCDKWYKYKRSQQTADLVVCPEGHNVAAEYQ
jgi:predicted RNA-binding Zn-ribbon protein involved in translation (DUF1610 family)